MDKLNIEDALYLYSLLNLGFKDAFDAFVIDAVNKGAGMDSFIYQLYLDLDDKIALSEGFENRLDHCLNNKEFYSKEWYNANLRLTSFFKDQYEQKKLGAKEVADYMGKAALISGCEAFKFIAGCYTDENTGIPQPVLDQALEKFLDTGRFVAGRHDVDLAKDKPDAYKSLMQGKLEEPSMGVIDLKMTDAFGSNVKLTDCWGPVQMCVFQMEYDYIPADFKIVFRCERGSIVGYLENRDGKFFNPLLFYPGENCCHDVHNDSDVRKIVNMVIRAVKENVVVFK